MVRIVSLAFIAAHGQPILKERIELEIETDTKTKISLPELLFFVARGWSM